MSGLQLFTVWGVHLWGEVVVQKKPGTNEACFGDLKVASSVVLVRYFPFSAGQVAEGAAAPHLLAVRPRRQACRSGVLNPPYRHGPVPDAGAPRVVYPRVA